MDLRIQVRQQPLAARACGFGERDRRVIDPPPIVQLVHNDPAITFERLTENWPHLYVHCLLLAPDGRKVVTLSEEPAFSERTRSLLGTLVSSPFIGWDENSDKGCFFCFPDLSIRTPGLYRLQFVLVQLNPEIFDTAGCAPILSGAMSDVFETYAARDFPGIRHSTPLTGTLRKQGLEVALRKGVSAGTVSETFDFGGNAKESRPVHVEHKAVQPQNSTRPIPEPEGVRVLERLALPDLIQREWPEYPQYVAKPMIFHTNKV